MYVLCCSDNTYYCGVTTDRVRRLKEHNKGKLGSKYTRSRRPVGMLYYEKHPDQSSAQIAESKFKKLNRKKKLDYMVEQCNRRSKQYAKEDEES